ncbi:DUF4199 domain-containing protein [Mucilaginibacter antarcticus]|uniref:DUF4199 domain-containing protein n=2 Tax=Mucilaginibacter antarcticus TaxID=1855725 RepID=A0ABW5XPT8_9SPHI
MKKIVLVCGLIAGLIAGGWAVFFISMCYKNASLENGMIYGYTAMLVGFSLIFVGIKNYRDNYLGGSISFGAAFKMGLMIAFIASSVYVVMWAIDYHFFVPDFDVVFSQHEVAKLQAAGASQAAITAKTAEMAQFTQDYKNPLYFIGMTYIEILPVGILVSVIAALILKKKKQDNIATA